MQEILVVIVIGLAVLLIPRMLKRNSSSESQSSPRSHSISQGQGINRIFKAGLPGWIRLIIVISVLWIAGCAAYLKPWENNTLLFFCVAVGPVVVVWGGIWVRAGYIKYRR